MNLFWQRRAGWPAKSLLNWWPQQIVLAISLKYQNYTHRLQSPVYRKLTSK
jgi:hypothetical protein